MHMAKPEPSIFETVQKAIENHLSTNCHSPLTSDLPPAVVFVDDILANRQVAEQTVHWQTFDSIDSLKSALTTRKSGRD